MVTEGVATEKQYVERLYQHLRDGEVAVSVKAVGVGKDPRSVVQKCMDERERAKKVGKAYDHCVCLVDVDRHATLDTAIVMASREGIDIVVSRLKFETWLRWHVSESRSVLSSKDLDEFVRKHDLLVDDKHVSPRFPFDQVDKAVRTAERADPELRAGRVGPDPSTAMPVLVRLLRGEKA